MKLYISGPMTGKPEHNFPAFNHAAYRLRRVGFDVENPADKGIIDGWVWTDYMRYDLAKLVECDGVALLPGWQDSPGANLEVYNAVQLELVVDDLESWVLKGRVEQWKRLKESMTSAGVSLRAALAKLREAGAA